MRVVIQLCLVAGELLIAVCGHSCVSCDPPFLYSHPGKVRQRIDGRRNDCDRPCCCSAHFFFLLACSARCRAFSFISGVQLSALERSVHRLTISEPSSMELYKMLPYLVTIIVLVAVSMRKKRENEPPAALGLAYFREERSFQSSTVFAVELCYYALLAATERVFMPQGGKKHVV